MARAAGTLHRAAVPGLIGFVLAAVGCVHTGPGLAHHPGPPIAVPPPGTVPAEMSKITLPEYVIEPPDVLRIEAYVITTAADRERARKEAEERAKKEGKPFEPDKTPDSGGEELRSLPLQPVYGEYQVRPDGTVNLGYWGAVPVAGYTLSQAADAIRTLLARRVYGGEIRPETIHVLLDVTQYNSKRYYVVLDGGGAGERVYPFPVTGSETVLDALANVNGLHEVASKRNIWVARRCPVPGHPEQILPVDWIGITQHGVTATNYQVMPGDRVYVKAQRLVTVDTALARIITPIERVLGVTLLGATTVNQIQGRGSGFGNPGF